MDPVMSDGFLPPLRSRKYERVSKGSADLMRQVLLGVEDLRRDNRQAQQLLLSLQTQVVKMRHAIDDIACGRRVNPRASP